MMDQKEIRIGTHGEKYGNWQEGARFAGGALEDEIGTWNDGLK